MNYLSVEYLIVYAFLGITVLVGSWGTTARTFKEYVNSNKEFGTGALVLTLLATNITGGTVLSYPNSVYEAGLAAVVTKVVLGILGTYLMVIYFVAPKIVHFQSCSTTGDLAEVFYGKRGRMLMGIMAFYFCACACARQFSFLKYMAVILGVNSSWGMVVMVAMLAIYTARGGMKAVTVTDIFHFVVAFAVIPLVVHLMLYQAGGFRAILNSLSTEQLKFFKYGAEPNYNTIITSVIISLVPIYTISFPYIQRMLMAKHQGQSVGMYRVGLLAFVAFALVLTLIGFAGIVLHPNLDANSHYRTGSKFSSSILMLTVEQFPPISKGLVWAAVLGIIISTCDSFLHIAGISFVQDIVKPLADRRGIAVDELRATRYSTLFIAFIALLISMNYRYSAYATYGMTFMGLLYVTPILGGIMGLKTHFREFFISMIATLSIFTYSTIVLQNKSMALLGGLVVNILSYLGVHYYYNRGLVIVQRSAYGQSTTIWHPSWQGARTALTSLVPTPQKLVRYFQQRITDNSSDTTTLALFVAVSYMVPLFMHSIGQPDAYEWLLVLRMVGALFCVGLLLQSMWPDNLLRFFPTYYHLALLYCFPFMTTFLFFLEGGSTEWVMNVMLSVMIFIFLLDYMTAVGLSIAGIALALALYKVGIGPIAFSMDRDTAYMLTYGVGFSIIIGALFSRLREKLLKQANRRLVNQEAALEAHFPAVMAESERRARAFQQIGIHSLLHTARKLHTIQHKTAAAQQEQQALLLSLAERQKALTQQLQDFVQQQQVPPAELLAQQKALQAEFDALTQQQLAPQPDLTAVDGQQAPHEELHTLAQHHLAPQAELNSLTQQQQDLQADLLPLVMQLQDLDTRGQDHLTLQVNKDLPLEEFLLSLQEKLLPRGIDVPLLIERKTKQHKISVDADQLAALLVKGIASLQWLLHDQDQYLVLSLEDTQLTYPLPDVAEGYMKQVPALRITLTATEKLPPLKASYRPDLTNFVSTTHQSFQDMEEQADKRLIKAHYGYTEVSEDTLTYVIPVDVYQVRPQDMDKPELVVGALPERSNDHFKHETADAQVQEEAFLKVVGARSNANLGVIKLALNLIKWYHGHKKRHTKEPFYLHPLAVAQIVMDYNQDEATIVGALLHDTVEDTPMLLKHVEALFGKDTAEVVDLVTHLQSMEGSMYKVKLSAEENLRMLGNTANTRGLYVKLADRMHNMRTIEGHKDLAKRQLIAQETMDFFVPLAKKLGLKEAVAEFEKMCEEVFAQKG